MPLPRRTRRVGAELRAEFRNIGAGLGGLSGAGNPIQSSI